MSLGDKATQLIYKKLCGSRSVSFMISLLQVMSEWVMESKKIYMNC